MGSEFFFASFAKITLTPFNGPRSTCGGLRSPLSKTLSTPWVQAGSGPAAAHFLCFAKESKQRKATAKPLPSLRSGPQMRQQSAGCEGKLASLKHAFPQFPADRCLIWQRPNAEFRNNPNVKSNINFKSNPNVKINFNGNFKSNVNPQRKNRCRTRQFYGEYGSGFAGLRALTASQPRQHLP